MEYIVTSYFDDTEVGKHTTLNLEMAVELIKVLIQMSSVTHIEFTKNRTH